MNELVVIVEGPTEQTFVGNQLARHLALFGTTVWAVLPGRRRNQGGVKGWEVARKDIVRTLKERRYCTTMFDYYALPLDWPGRAKAGALPWSERASHVEERIRAEICIAMGDRFDPKFFLPYIQLHEFEALTFADVQTLASFLSPLSRSKADTLKLSLAKILAEAGNPEAINDGYETCPSRRISNLVPAYKKPLHGPIVTDRIGLEMLRERCHHFASWLQQLEAIGTKLT